MANQCNEDVVFYQKDGGIEHLERFYTDFKKAIPGDLTQETVWVGTLLSSLGVSEEVLNSSEWFCRAELESIRFLTDETPSLYLSALTDWQPSIQVWDWLADYYQLDYVVFAEEEGSGFYLNTDVNHKFLTSRFVLLEEGGETSYFKTADELIHQLNELASFYQFEPLKGDEFELEELNTLCDELSIYKFHTHCRVLDDQVVEAFTL